MTESQVYQLIEDIRDALRVTDDAKALGSLAALQTELSRLRSEIEGQRESLDEWIENWNARERHVNIIRAENDALRSELELLRSSILSPEEARHVISQAFASSTCTICQSAFAKLRRISSDNDT